MIEVIEFAISPELANDTSALRDTAAKRLGIPSAKIEHITLLRRSLDARSRLPVYRIKAEVYHSGEAYIPEAAIMADWKPLGKATKQVIIIGAGPAGYFAALQLLEMGIKPIVLDRGKDVRARRRDLKAIQQEGIVHPHSNYCFGEGGAGTYSDGKLYTRSHKRGDIKKALKLLVEHGAQSDILVDAHPHIGSNKLPNVVANIRATIEQYGGEVHFGQYVTDFIQKNNKLLGVATNLGEHEWLGDAVILATGHSARDIYHLLLRHRIRIEAKPFALGVRVEHPQPLIDEIQYRTRDRGVHLPAAAYSAVCQINGGGVFSFCMCPGGLVVPAATQPGEIVVNGMSMSRRDSPYANSGVVAAVEMLDIAPWHKHGALSMLEFQRSVEQAMFAAGDGSQKAPAQRLTDFIKGRESAHLPGTSYIPGIFSAPVHTLLPNFIANKLREGLKEFGKQMRGYMTEEANVIGTESRTSAPVRIPRNPDNLMHSEVSGLFPCGEGAGYAGGIISAAMDGQAVAVAVARYLGVSAPVA